MNDKSDINFNVDIISLILSMGLGMIKIFLSLFKFNDLRVIAVFLGFSLSLPLSSFKYICVCERKMHRIDIISLRLYI